MIKEFDSKIENYSDNIARNKYGIKESDFIDLLKRQLDEFKLTETSERKNDTYIDSDYARKLLYSLHMKICEIKGVSV